MMVRKFYADTAREALRLVREKLGPNALILSNRRTGAGVEVMAVPEDEIASVTGGVAKRAPTRAPAAPPPAEPPAAPVHHVSVQPQAPPAGGYDLVQEVRILRSMLEGQLAAFAWSDLWRGAPAKVEVLRHLLAAGFSAGFARRAVEPIVPGLDAARALRLVKIRLQQQLRIAPADQSPVEAGGVYALVGPTGVGKTTTVAKVAAECTLKRGAQSVALVTTDTYRIGAVDQLRIYGRILNAPVFAIRSPVDFASTLVELRARHLVLIDTVGMSQRDQRLTEQIAMLAGSGKPVRRLLLLSAVSQANVLEDVVRAYRGTGLAGCILTKTDESLTLGGALDVLIRHRLNLEYVTNGQRVPEDLHRPNPLYLIERAFRAPADAPPRPADADYPLMYAAGISPALTGETIP